ncbi:MAG: hypothetical protein IPN29_16120 [Saprospiraceae bacterium]|nr:hypothetical protein [Saprospiraceae bacterium]
MTAAKFYVGLLALAGSLVMVCYFWFDANPNQYGSVLAYSGIAAFSLLNVGFFHLASLLSLHSADQAYLRMIYLNFLIKLIVAVALPAFFYFQGGKGGTGFIVPFVLIYVVFTVFETWMLNRLAVMRK